MKLGTEDRKKLITAVIAGVLALGAAFYLYSELFGGTTAPTPPQPAVAVTSTTENTPRNAAIAPPGNAVAAEKVGTTSGQLDPSLHMEAMRITESLVYTGSGRNIFAPGSPEAPKQVKQVVIPKSDFTARNTPPPPPIPQGPPPPPPINLKFFGTETNAAGVRKAFLLNGDDVFLAGTGDIVQRKYRVIAITANSIQVEDIPNSNKQSLPMIPN